MLTQSQPLSLKGVLMEVASTNPTALSKSALILPFLLAPTCFDRFMETNPIWGGISALSPPKSLPHISEELVIGFAAERITEELTAF